MAKIILERLSLSCLVLSLLLTACSTQQAPAVPQPLSSTAASSAESTEPQPALTEVQVSTLSGDKTVGFQDGPGAQARFNHPSSVVSLPDGNFLVLDRYNHRIRKVEANGQTTTYWGNGERGNRDGALSEDPRLNQPISMIRSADGSLLLADAQNHSIRKISADGTLSTLTGNGSEGYQEGQMPQAALNWPSDLALDEQTGILYIADRFNHAIRKLTPEGELSTLAGDGTPGMANGKGTAARFNEPMGLVLGPDQQLYVADGQNNLIRKVSLQGDVTTVAGSGQAGSRDDLAAKAEFRGPTGLSFDLNGNLLIADRFNHLIRMLSPEGKVSTLAGSGQEGDSDGKASEASFDYPYDLATDAKGDVYVIDYVNHALRKIQRR